MSKLMVVRGGFEPPKLARQIYSLIPLATREPHLTFKTLSQYQNLENFILPLAVVPAPRVELGTY